MSLVTRIYKMPAKEWKGGHNHMCNLSFWEGRFQKFYRKCEFVLKDRKMPS